MTRHVSWAPILLAAVATTAGATPTPAIVTRAAAVAAAISHDGAHAKVTFTGTVTSSEADAAKQIERLLHGPLRGGTTGLLVADARTGDPLFAVNADDAFNPASNVKMISTATALELLGADFRYPTRALAALPDADGAIHGGVYLLGSYDPTLTAADLDELSVQLVARGVHAIHGGVVIGADASRDGLYRASVPVAIAAGAPGAAPTATMPEGYDLVTAKVTATTARFPMRPRLAYAQTTTRDAAGIPHVELAISGVIGKGGSVAYPMPTTERTVAAADALRASLIAHGIRVDGGVKIAELGDFVGDDVAAGTLPIVLARHDSAPLAEIVAHVNKWSINWLADRVIMTAAALHDHAEPSMTGALAAMYGWLGRHTIATRDNLTVDTGSGLSYQTKITPHELVAIVRGAGGFAAGSDAELSRAWLASLSIGGRDGTLTHRFADLHGALRGKTGTLSTAIALSGILDVDPARPIVFSIVTNTKRPLSPVAIRKAHEQIVAVLARYVAKTAKHVIAPVVPTPVTPAVPATPPHEPLDLDSAEPDETLDAETAAEH